MGFATCSSMYDEYPEDCGKFDSDKFVAAELCCACGGVNNTQTRSNQLSLLKILMEILLNSQ